MNQQFATASCWLLCLTKKCTFTAYSNKIKTINNENSTFNFKRIPDNAGNGRTTENKN
jgi:hypothetical protein